MSIDPFKYSWLRQALERVIEFIKCYVVGSMTARYALADTQWENIKDFLPGRAGSIEAPAQDNRLRVDAVLYRYRAHRLLSALIAAA